MPFNYGAVDDKARVISLTIPYENMGTIVLDYRPAVISKDDLLARSKAETETPEESQTIKAQYFMELVAKWDVCWPDNTPIALTLEDLAKVKDVFLQNIINAILQDAYVGEAKGQRIKRH